MTTALHADFKSVRLTDRLSAHLQSRTADEVDLEAGMSTAEYAVGTIAACTFAGVLLAIFKSGGIHDLIVKVFTFALNKLFN